MVGELSDKRLLELAASANHDAFAELVRRYTDQLYRLAFRSLQNRGDAEDVVQNMFIKLWQNPLQWDPQKSQLSTWLYRLVVNACHDVRRRHSRSIDMADESLFALSEIQESSAQNQRPSNECQDILQAAQSHRWQQQCLEYAIAKLPSSQRDALNLVVYSELPQRQAAEVMDISLKALESLLVRAKRKIFQIVQQLKEAEAANASQMSNADQPTLSKRGGF